MDIKGLVENMVHAGAFQQIADNPLAQFGPPRAPFLFADVLPEKMVPVNQYTEEGIRYRTVIANAGTRYSPVQIKQGVITGSMNVTLGYSDIGSHFTSADYDALLRLLLRFTGTQGTLGGGVDRPIMTAATMITDWVDQTLVRPLLSHNELNRVNALVNAQVTLTGDNGFREVVNYPNPTGARVVAGGTWSNNTYDPWPDIMARKTYLASKGYRIGRIITSTPVITKMSNNQQIRARAGYLSLVSGTVAGLAGMVSIEQLNAMAQRDGLPPFETYDRVYYTQQSYGYFLQQDAMLFLCTTGRDMRIERGDVEPVVKADTLGYTAIGRAAGQADPGRVVKTRVKDDSKPPRIEGESWQSSFPVITDPEAVSCITGIA